MKIQLLRPIAFIDLECTGTNRETDRIVEIAICKLHPDGSRENKRRLINPGIPIPPVTTEIHGITDEMVKEAPTFRDIAKGLLELLEGCDIGGFNSNAFDCPMLFNEFARAGIYWDYTQFKMIDVGNLFKIREPRTLSAAVKFYTGNDLENAHSAEADINATVDVFLSQLDRYPDLPDNVEELALISNHGRPVLDLSGKFSLNEKGEIILNFKYKGERAEDHLDFIEWMYYKADFPADTRKICEELLFEADFRTVESDLPY